MDDYEIIYDHSCPMCGHSELRTRQCTNFCEMGYIDESDDDPINFFPGESLRKCTECKGTGDVTWCPACGADLTGVPINCDDDDEREWP